MEPTTNISTPSTQLKTELPPSTCYHHIVDLPLRVFIEVSCNDNLAALILSGFPSELELFNAWQTIKEEYALAMGNQDQALYVNLFKQVQKLQLTIEQIDIAVNVLKWVYVEAFAVQLNKLLNTTLHFPVNDPGTYEKNLKKCISLAKRFQITIDMKLAQLEAMQKTMAKADSGDVKAVNKEYFYSILITLSDHAEYPIHDTITVYEFCERIRRLNDHIALLAKQNSHGR